MTAKVINFYLHRERDEKNALSVVREYFDVGPAIQIDPQLVPGDRFLAWLWLQGYKVVPLDSPDQ